MCSSKKTVVSLFAFSGDVAVRAVAVMHVAVAEKSGLIAFMCIRPASRPLLFQAVMFFSKKEPAKRQVTSCHLKCCYSSLNCTATSIQLPFPFPGPGFKRDFLIRGLHTLHDHY